MSMIHSILENRPLVISFLSLFIAQVLKIITHYIKHKEFDLSRAVGSGGMPSSHSSTVMALSTTIGLEYGWDSPLYAITLVFGLLVMYDASGVRLAVGKQARILNNIILEVKEGFKRDGMHIFTSKELRTDEKLKELIGHTKTEVIVGGLLGVLLAIVLFDILG